MRRTAGQIVLVSMSALMFVGTPGCKDKGADPAKRVLVLGFDGMDPKLVRRMIDAGRMPHFAKLEKQGGFLPLETSIPPQSPVAWSNFITGTGPGVHGIFDFIHRDPTKQALPYFSTSHDSPGEEPWLTIPIGGFRFSSAEFNPWSKGAATELARRGTPFWDYLDERGISVRMYRLPANYPPSESKHGHMCCLSGMGVPDALGSQGTYQHFTTRPRAERHGGEGYQFRLRRNFKTKAYVAKLRGPSNEYLDQQDSSGSSGHADEMTIDLNIYRDPDRPVAKIIYTNAGIAGDQTVEIVLNEGEWSDWKEVAFLKRPVVGPVLGTIARFYLAQVRPELELYVTPLNFDPVEPGATFSEPAEFVTEIGSEVGPFYTQGFAEDFKARDTGIFDDAEYKTQADMVLAERFKLLDYALKHFEDGLLFFYFSSSDLQAHIFWWDSDEPHPVRTPEEARKYNAVIEDVYVKMDEALGRCMEVLGDEATIIVMSDHGFCNFRRQFGLNTWLRDEGYLVTRSDTMGHLINTENEWRRTKAYGLGL
ncbi:MAG: alkaline phosphatase family protein, partial [Planctomycetota bacterium]|nr:alkaline phosphatase family protein [Planctomycetota bacterium]